jgi:hypothetical protein
VAVREKRQAFANTNIVERRIIGRGEVQGR